MGIRGLIIEGISGAGKTTVLNRLRLMLARIPQEAHVVLTQQYTQRLVEHLGPKKRPEDVVALLSDLLLPLETWSRRFEASVFADHPRRQTVEFTYVIETFHLNNLIEGGFAFDDDFRMIDRRVAALGARMAFLWIPVEDIRERSIESTRRHRGPKWLGYQEALAPDVDALTELYRRRQDRLLAMAKEGRVPIQIIDTRDIDWDRIAEDVYRVWQEPGPKEGSC
jgi:hypothetical protein